MTVAHARRPAGDLLRRWRERRRLSQLELSNQAGISTRHLSFLETGRSRPSREMLLRLAGELEVPLRERNQLLLAAGFAPVYPQATLDSDQLAPVRAALRRLLSAHEPYPAVVIDGGWNLVEATASVAVLTAGAAPDLLRPPVNVLRLSLYPDGLADRIVNLGEWRAHLLGRLRRQVALTGDEQLADLYAELSALPGAEPAGDGEPPGPGELAVPLRLRHAGRELAFLSTVATFGTPLDVTVAELAIESFFPADAATADALRAGLLSPDA